MSNTYHIIFIQWFAIFMYNDSNILNVNNKVFEVQLLNCLVAKLFDDNIINGINCSSTIMSSTTVKINLLFLIIS